MPSQRQIDEHRQRRQAKWPIIGLLTAVSLGVIAWFSAPMLLQFIRQQSPQFSIGTLSETQQQLILAAIIFVVLGALVTMIMAFFAPKPKTTVKDSTLKKEKKQIEAEQKARRARRMAIEAEMRKQNRERSQK